MNLTEHGSLIRTLLVEKGYHCAANISIVANDKVVDVKTVNFSKS